MANNPDDYPWYDPRAYSGYIRGEEGLAPDAWTGGNPTKEAIKTYTNPGGDDGMIAGDQSSVTQHIPGWDDPGVDKTFDWLSGTDKEFTEPVYESKDQGYGSHGMDWYRKNLDPNDPEMVKNLQSFLGIESDGKFGPQTQNAWRRAVSLQQGGDERMGGTGEERGDQLSYDYNPEMLDHRVSQSGPVKGMLQKGWSNFDKKLGGILPGGDQKKYRNMTQAEYDQETFEDVGG